MRFTLLDRIVELEPGRRITAVKALALAEEYLADHFPLFPVMPGVLMLEAMTQASAWLIRASEDFQHSLVVLKEAKNVKYADFVAPGQLLTITAEIVSQDATETRLKAQGVVDGRTSVSGRLTLSRSNRGGRDGIGDDTDAFVRQEMKRLFSILYTKPIDNATLAPSA